MVAISFYQVVFVSMDLRRGNKDKIMCRLKMHVQ